MTSLVFSAGLFIQPVVQATVGTLVMAKIQETSRAWLRFNQLEGVLFTTPATVFRRIFDILLNLLFQLIQTVGAGKNIHVFETENNQFPNINGHLRKAFQNSDKKGAA